MDVRAELLERLLRRENEKHLGLSQGALLELKNSIALDMDSFIETEEERAYAQLLDALEEYERARHNDNALEDEQFEKSRRHRLLQLKDKAHAIANACPWCLEAQIIEKKLLFDNPDDLLTELFSLENEYAPLALKQVTPDAWDDIFCRPYLRVLSSIVGACMESARYRMGLDYSSKLLELSASDGMLARLNAALIYARLEDEQGFDLLDRRFARNSTSWSNLARVVLLFKLDRMDAASRALKGYNQLSVGGAYALLRPIFVDYYLPDRPQFSFDSFAASVLTIHDAEPVIVDVPDFISWSQEHEWLVESAKSYAREQDLDW